MRPWKVPAIVWLLADDESSARTQAMEVFGDGSKILFSRIGRAEEISSEQEKLFRQFAKAILLLARLPPEKLDELMLTGLTDVFFSPAAADELIRLQSENSRGEDEDES